MVPLVKCNSSHHSAIVSTMSMHQVKRHYFLILQIIIAAYPKIYSEFVGTRYYCVVQYVFYNFL